MKIVVTQCDYRFGYNVSKSLTKAGHSVISCGQHTPTLAHSLNNIIDEIVYPDPFTYPLEYIKAINLAVKKHNADAFLPVHEDVFIASYYRNKIDTETLIAPSFNSLIDVHDKFNVFRKCRSIDVSTPETIRVSSLSEVRAFLKEIKDSIVLKPRFGEGTRGVIIIKNEKYLNRKSKTIKQLLSKTSYLAQKFFKGKGVGVGCVVKEGRLIALSPHIRLREMPPSGGTSIARRTFRNKRIENAAKKFIESTQFNGVVMLEFKFNPTTDEHVLIDVNPRYWGGLATAIESGVDIPKIHLGLVQESYPENIIYPQKIIESRWALGEIGWIFSVLFSFRLEEIKAWLNQNNNIKVIYEDGGYQVLIQLRTYLKRYMSKNYLKGDNVSKQFFFKSLNIQ